MPAEIEFTLAGSGPLLLAVADLLRISGAEVPVIIEQAPAGKINAFGFSLLQTPGKLLRCEIATDGFARVDSSLRTTVKDIYAIGELTGIGGVDKAILEVQIAGLAIAGDASAVANFSSQHARAIDFTRRLAAAFSLRDELFHLAKPDTLICRCEDVPLSALVGSTGSRDAKLQTRCGMGPCQGRICGPILQQLMHSEAAQVRPPVLACRVGSLCGGSSGA
jgi:NADPH-dependent 2,4-dienoyl-CoA reductase/sulfur reductase-like enzyme